MHADDEEKNKMCVGISRRLVFWNEDLREVAGSTWSEREALQVTACREYHV